MRLFKIFQPVSIVLIIYAVFTVDLLWYYQGDISCLVHAGPGFTSFADAPAELCKQDGADGYDGQYNYRMALNPFSNKPVENGIWFDQNIYRHQRIFYPLLAWALTGGSRVLVPYAFVLINLAAMAALAAMGAVYALDRGRSPYWSLGLALYIGFFISYAVDLGHAPQIALMFGAVFCLRRRDWLAVLLLTCAVLTRETAVLFALAIAAQAFFERWKWWPLYLLPAGALAAWQVFLQWFWRGVPDYAPGPQVGVPLVGFFTGIASRWSEGDFFGLFLLLALGAFFILGFWSLRRSTAPLYIKLSWLLYSALFLTISYEVWMKFNGYMRGLSEWFFVGCLLVFPVIPVGLGAALREWPRRLDAGKVQ